MEIFSGTGLDLDRLSDVFENANIDRRYFSKPLEWWGEERSFEQKNRAYIDSALKLGEQACRKCLENAAVKASDVDHIIFINTTGLATPSIDARLLNLLDFKSDIRRTPIWGLGCAGGAAALSQAHHYLLGHPDQRVLIYAVELCGLTFQQNDLSKSNFVATALFGEGASAVLLSGDNIHSNGPAIIDTRSMTWPDSLDIMGWDITNEGMQVVFSIRIPGMIKKHVHADMTSFLKRHDLSLEDIQHFIFHPGGSKVIEAYEKSLNLNGDSLDVSRKILKNYGNMSSVTVLFVLEDFLKNGSVKSDDLGVVSALGPGFSAESLLLKF